MRVRVRVRVRVYKINNEELFFNAFLFGNSYYLSSGLAYMWCVARVTCLVHIMYADYKKFVPHPRYMNYTHCGR